MVRCLELNGSLNSSCQKCFQLQENEDIGNLD